MYILDSYFDHHALNNSSMKKCLDTFLAPFIFSISSQHPGTSSFYPTVIARKTLDTMVSSLATVDHVSQCSAQGLTWLQGPHAS